MASPDPSPQFRIKRKPVTGPQSQPSYAGDDLKRPPLPPTVSSNTVPDVSETRAGEASNAPSVQRAATDVPPASKPQDTSKSAIHKAYGEARHFLGGLIAHPTESNRHFTILRHSHGVVFYRGSTTTITISIFSDAPLPPDRTLWLQSRGFSGKAGMKTKAFLRLHDDWLNVTPAMAVTSDQVNPADERAWQRDIGKFRKKAPPRVRDTHLLRETAIARVPMEAGDGYFSVVLCRGEKKKTLCTSPVFRVLSTSADPSTIRGASLSTLPLELGAMVAGMYAQTVAQGAVAPVTTAVKNKISPLQPGLVTQTAATTAFDMSGIGDRVGSSISNSDKEQSKFGHPPGVQDSFSVDQGPIQPYPMDFKARGEVPTQGTSGLGMDEMPRLTLRKVPDWVLDRFDGYYFGWARYEEMLEKMPAMGSWQPAILNVKHFDPTESARVNISQAMKRMAFVRFVEEIELPSETKIDVRIMGFLRPPPPPAAVSQASDERETAAEAAMIAQACDASFVQSVLDHPAWAPETVSQKKLQRENTGMMERTKTGLSSVKSGGQKVAEQVPLHWIGVRSPLAERRDRQVTVNGFYIIR